MSEQVIAKAFYISAKELGIMQVYNEDEFKIYKNQIYDKIKNGAVFIHPTDTIYGLGCDAQNASAVKRIREIKHRYEQPFSVIAPSKEWIISNSNCPNKKECDKWLMKLPGPYTLIIQLDKKSIITKETNNNLNTLGVRIPSHWFSNVAKELNIPIVTTSVNVTGESFMTSMDDLDETIKSKVDMIILDGEKNGKPSKIIDLTKEKTETKVR